MPHWTAEDTTLIRSQIERMSACPVFAQAQRMGALLKYLVEAELEGTADRLNQYRIAIDVLGRDERFDPAEDSIVRVEMRRLRSKLLEFYATEGAEDPVVLGLPKGSYQPVVELRTRVPERGPAAAMPKQEIRYCRAEDGVNIAYATSGQGYPFVKAANWLSHLEFDYQSPVWRHWWRDLGRKYRLIRYDERGCGLSDWEVPDFTFDAWVRDLEDVVAAARPEKFALFGMSQGVPVAIAYAVAHPERVSHLILYGGFARGPRKRPDPIYLERANVLKQLIHLGWRDPHHAFRQVFATLFIPDASTEQTKWFDDLQRVSTSTANAERFWDTCCEIDVTHLLGRVEVPTLVMHSSREMLVPFSETQTIASGIKGAKLTVLDSNNHILLEDEPSWPRFLEEIDAFITGNRTPDLV